MVHSLTAGPAVAEHYREVIPSFVPLLKPGRTQRADSLALPDSTEEMLIGSLATALTRLIMADDIDNLDRLTPDLTAFVLMPYLGPEEARRIAAEAAAES